MAGERRPCHDDRPRRIRIRDAARSGSLQGYRRVIPQGREPQDVEVLTFGCRLNLVESEAMRRAALACGRSNLIIVNTCAVTAEAERQARQAIRRVKRARPAAEIVVTGCAAQIDPYRFTAMPEVSRVLGNAEKANPASWARGGARVDVSNVK